MFLTANSSLMNCIDSPLSIIAEPAVSLFRRTGGIIALLHPRSAKFISVDPKPLDPYLVIRKSLTRMHSRFSIHSRISWAMRSPVLI